MKYQLLILDLEGTLVSLAASGPVVYPGVESTLKRLRSEGVLLAIATGASRAALNRVLAQSGLATLVDSARTADDCFSKPHPQMLLELMDEYNTLPEDCLMVGDSLADIQAAQNAGVDVVFVDHLRSGYPDKQSLSVLAVINRFEGLLGLVGIQP